MNKPHLRYYGTFKFDICSTLNSLDVETKLKTIFNDFNNTESFTGICDEVEFDKVALCTDGCFGEQDEDDC